MQSLQLVKSSRFRWGEWQYVESNLFSFLPNICWIKPISLQFAELIFDGYLPQENVINVN